MTIPEAEQALEQATAEQVEALRASEAAADAFEQAERALETGEAEAILDATATIEAAEDEHVDARDSASDAHETVEIAAESAECPLCGHDIGAAALRLIADAARAADHEAAETQVELNEAKATAERTLAETVEPLTRAVAEAQQALQVAATRNRTAGIGLNAARAALERARAELLAGGL